MAILDLGVLKVSQFTVDGSTVGSLQELGFECLGDLGLDTREDHYCQVLMHYLDDSTILLEEVEPWRAFRQFLLWVVLQNLIDLEAKGEDDFFLLTELQVLPLVLQLELFESLIDAVKLLHQQLVRDR